MKVFTTPKGDMYTAEEKQHPNDMEHPAPSEKLIEFLKDGPVHHEDVKLQIAADSRK